MTPQETARRIVERFVLEFNGRRGFRQNWDAIDDEIQQECIAAWMEIVVEELIGAKP